MRTSITYSIIIPSYQSESTIGKCLQSLLSSSRSDFELIVIDDYSTDATRDILASIEDVRLKIMRPNENGGVAKSRNIGVEEAKGEYIAFVDSDDYVPEDYFDNLDQARQTNADIAIFNFIVVEQDGSTHIKRTEYAKKGKLSQREVFRNMCIECSEGPWNKLYKASLISQNQLKFDPGTKMWEDMLFFAKAVHCAQIIQAFDSCIYFYRITGTGLTSLNVNTYAKDFLHMNRMMYHYLSENKEDTENLTNYSVRWLYDNLSRKAFSEATKQMIVQDKIIDTVIRSKTSNIKVIFKQLMVRWHLKKIERRGLR